MVSPAKRPHLMPSTSGEPNTVRAISADYAGTSGPPPPSALVVRGRGGFQNTVLVTMPPDMAKDERCVRPDEQSACRLLTNFVRIIPMEEKPIYQYRVEFRPEVESISLRQFLFNAVKKSIFPRNVMFDGTSEARSCHKIEQVLTELTTFDPRNDNKEFKVYIKFAGVVGSPHERLRIYNMHMKRFLADLGFFKISKHGAFVHPSLSTPIGDNQVLKTVRGFNTAANLHRNNELLMNLESVHKLMQEENVLRSMSIIRRWSADNYQMQIKWQLVGKQVVTSYKSRVYRIEDVLFDQNPTSTFVKGGKTISLVDYLKETHHVQVEKLDQPLLLCIDPTRKARSDQESIEIKLVPELCNMAGLTDQQRQDNKIKTALIKSSQIPAERRVDHLKTFLKLFHEKQSIREKLAEWGYSYEKELLKIKGRLLNRTKIGLGGDSLDQSTWGQVDDTASFDKLVMSAKIRAQPPHFKMALVYSPNISRHLPKLKDRLRAAMDKIGLQPSQVLDIETTGDQAAAYVQKLRDMPIGWCALILVCNQQKPRYDAIKKICAVEKGAITQVVTDKLLLDERKASGAAVKIGIQLAAKLGAEPWHVDIPLKTLMVCGYDTYHDTTNRGRSYGAFVSNVNSTFSRWFSKAGCHERLDEISSHMSENLTAGIQKWRENNGGRLPDRIVVYRDGVGDGQLQHVHEVELTGLRRACYNIDRTSALRMSLVVVNKRVGARFYLNQRGNMRNPYPGTVVDDVVTRDERFDFYLISQSTRHGTLTPTYYNILANDSGCLGPSIHQMLAYKLCFMYYNWTGTVRVPAPCQYAHKLAYLCGEHLHSVPHANLDDRLHFL